MLVQRLTAASARLRALALAVAAAVILSFAGSATAAEPSGPPIRIGSTLALTGPLSATALVHKVAGEIFVEQLNAKGGLLGRPVEWIVKDDQSKPDVARTLYEQLITVDKVDLLMGPYATGNILAAMAVAQRYGKVLVHHTLGIPSLAKYDMQFPAWSVGADPSSTVPNMVLDALAANGKAPKTVAVVTSKFPSVFYMSEGARKVLQARGVKEVLYLEWEFGNRDFGPIAARVKDANPDFLWVGAIGLEGNQLLDAMAKIDYHPPLHYYVFPAPGPMAKAAVAQNAMAGSIFEEHPPYTERPGAAEFIARYHERAAKAGLSDTEVETQAAASYTAWQILTTAVTATRSLDDKTIAAWIKSHRIDTLQGSLRFDGVNNYGDDLSGLKQVQDGHWVTVWPKQWAAPGAKLITQ